VIMMTNIKVGRPVKLLNLLGWWRYFGKFFFFLSFFFWNDFTI